MLKVLYVAAWGRSGTTLVDNVLNGYPGVFSAGELHYLWRRGLIAKRSCGCGEPVTRCPVWGKILTAAFGSDRPDPRHVVNIQRRVTRTRGAVSLLRRPWSAEIQEYADLMSRLYLAIGEITGASLVVDSSKLPAEAALLTRLTEVEPYLLHMVRDPRAVAYSWSRRKVVPDRGTAMMQHTASRSTVNWLVWNGLTEMVAARYPGRHRRLRYEDFVADPQGQIDSLLRLVGVADGTGLASGDGDGPFLDPATVRLAANHTVSGNPGRFRIGDVRIRDDDRWRSEQRVGPRLTASALSLPLTGRYRYPLWPRRPESTPAEAAVPAPAPSAEAEAAIPAPAPSAEAEAAIPAPAPSAEAAIPAPASSAETGSGVDATTGADGSRRDRTQR
jgi:hypothetical protein